MLQSYDSMLTFRERFSKAMDLELFRDPVYLNISFGLALSFTGDLSFVAIFPLILTNLAFDHSQITTIMTIFFASDLVARILLTVVSGVVAIRNRYLFLGATLLSAAFRIGNKIWKCLPNAFLNLNLLQRL